MVLTVRTSERHTPNVAEMIAKAVSAAHAEVAVGRIVSMPARVRAVSASTRFYAAVLLTLGGAGLALAVVGIVGVVLQLVTSRRRDLTIRMAMGATGAQLLTAVLRSVSSWVLVGIVLGVVVGWPVYQALRTLPFEVRPADPLTLAAVSIVVFGSALAAALFAAKRILRMSPREAEVPRVCRRVVSVSYATATQHTVASPTERFGD
jgi:putative ABC transport system permease protein